jgi:hypothetical protein
VLVAVVVLDVEGNRHRCDLLVVGRLAGIVLLVGIGHVILVVGGVEASIPARLKLHRNFQHVAGLGGGKGVDALGNGAPVGPGVGLEVAHDAFCEGLPV